MLILWPFYYCTVCSCKFFVCVTSWLHQHHHHYDNQIVTYSIFSPEIYGNLNSDLLTFKSVLVYNLTFVPNLHFPCDCYSKLLYFILR